MKVVTQSAWAVLLQIGAATAVVIGGLCIGALLTAVIDKVLK